jgi:hypothetical protein
MDRFGSKDPIILKPNGWHQAYVAIDNDEDFLVEAVFGAWRAVGEQFLAH